MPNMVRESKMYLVLSMQPSPDGRHDYTLSERTTRPDGEVVEGFRETNTYKDGLRVTERRYPTRGGAVTESEVIARPAPRVR